VTPPQFALFIVAYALTCLLVAQEIANVFTADSHYALVPEEDAPTVGRVGSFGVVVRRYGGMIILIGSTTEAA
jgi:hypothetical protein